MPAIVTASIFVHCKVIASTCWTHKLAWLVAWFKLVEVVQNGKSHGQRGERLPSWHLRRRAATTGFHKTFLWATKLVKGIAGVMVGLFRK
ncbi:MAG: hypothetical protein ACO22U_14570 [bacterium]